MIKTIGLRVKTENIAKLSGFVIVFLRLNKVVVIDQVLNWKYEFWKAWFAGLELQAYIFMIIYEIKKRHIPYRQRIQACGILFIHAETEPPPAISLCGIDEHVFVAEKFQ